MRALDRAIADVIEQTRRQGRKLAIVLPVGPVVMYGTVVKRLLKSRAQVNAADAAGLTPLMLAAAGGHAEMATLLLAWGADVSVKAGSGATALSFAQRGGHSGVEELLRAVGARE